jgi:O-antigen/teichoic acid export membrane protein
VTGLIVHNARGVLYPRFAAYFRADRSTAKSRYYSENKRLLLIGVLLPALVAGFANLIVQILYDVRYEQAGHILMVLALGALLSAFLNASENMMVASGKNHFVFAGNAIWLISVIPASLIGYYTFGFEGFLWFNLAARLPSLCYFYYEQGRYGLLDLRAEIRMLLLALGVFFICLLLSHILLAVMPAGLLHLRFRK